MLVELNSGGFLCFGAVLAYFVRGGGEEKKEGEKRDGEKREGEKAGILYEAGRWLINWLFWVV